MFDFVRNRRVFYLLSAILLVPGVISLILPGGLNVGRRAPRLARRLMGEDQGGKVVAGTLNGGGVEIQAATLSGDIILKKAE